MITSDAINPSGDDFIDRIVDGELSPAELRAAIDQLDRQPDGWKCCTLAFLEAQCWRESLRAMGESAVSPPVGSPSPLQSASRTGTARRWIRGPIAAAILAASFALGWGGHAAGPWLGGEVSPIASAGAKPVVPMHGAPSGLSEIPDVDQRATSQLLAGRPVEKPSLPTVNEVVRAVGRLHIGARSTGADVPILAGPGINEQWLKSQPPPVTESGQVALARAGYHVDQRRRFIMKTLADGRRVAVPVDQVQIRHTGNDPL